MYLANTRVTNEEELEEEVVFACVHGGRSKRDAKIERL